MTIFDIARYRVPRRNFLLSLAIFGLIIGLAGCPSPTPPAPTAELPQITAAASIAPLTLDTALPEGGIVIASKSGGGDIASCEVASDSTNQLPTGLELAVNADGHCVITGTPTGTMSRTYNVKIVARNSGGISNAIDLVLNVNAFPVSISANKDGSDLAQPHASPGDSITITLTVPSTGTYTYAWKQKIGEEAATTLGETSATLTPTLPTPPAGSTSSITYSATITRNDNVTASATLSLTVHSAPVATITSPTAGSSAEESSELTLNGSTSTGTGLTYAWTVSGTGTTTITNANMAEATYVLPAVSTDTMLTFTLTVTNPAGAIDSATVMLTVTPVIGTLSLNLAGRNFDSTQTLQIRNFDSTQTLQIIYNAVASETPTILYTTTTDGTEPADPSLPASNPTSYTLGTNIPILQAAESQYRIRAIARRGSSTSAEITGTFTRTNDIDKDGVLNDMDIDDDNDGLIEITGATMADQLTMLHNMRYNLAGTNYKTSDSDAGTTTGAPTSATANCTSETSTGSGIYLCGYELTGNLSFDKGSNGTWSNTGTADAPVYTLDSADSASPYFVTASGGWLPIGTANSDGNRFTAVFEGNGHSITGLAVQRDLTNVGMFGVMGAGAEIRNLGLVNVLADYSGSDDDVIYVGGLVGFLQVRGQVTASYSTGSADGGEGDDDFVGGLIGYQNGGQVTASYSSASADGGAGDFDSVGGLVGYQVGQVIASYSSGNANGGAGRDSVGGLVGYQAGQVIASYSSASADGGAGDRDYVGGLIGRQNGGQVTASYFSGNADGGAGSDYVGGLVGYQNGGQVTASYSNGSADGGEGDDDYVGGLVGRQRAGQVTASYSSGNANGGAGRDFVGGLVGVQVGGSVTASYSSGSADGGDGNNDFVGGLVGYQAGGQVTASYSTGNADGGAGDTDYVGGLVGVQFGGSVTASYSTGNADGGAGDTDHVGGLVGVQEGGQVTASYSTGSADGGAGAQDYVGGLIGVQAGGQVTASYSSGNANGGDDGDDVVGSFIGLQSNGLTTPVTASYGFGTATGETPSGTVINGGTAGIAGTDKPMGVSDPAGLTEANAGTGWNAAASASAGAWDFTTKTRSELGGGPSLRYADYDGTDSTNGTTYHCTGATAGATTSIEVPCTTGLIPGQQ